MLTKTTVDRDAVATHECAQGATSCKILGVFYGYLNDRYQQQLTYNRDHADRRFQASHIIFPLDEYIWNYCLLLTALDEGFGLGVLSGR